MNSSIQRIAYILCTLLTLAIFSPSSHADWIDFAEDKNTVIYSDPETAKVEGNLIRVWSMVDIKEGTVFNNKRIYSIKTLLQFDCKNDLVRNKYIAMYTEHMGKGAAAETFNTPNPEWDPLMPRTPYAVLGNMLCKHLIQ